MNTESKLSPSLYDPDRFGACGVLLSMDCMQRFIALMGLQLDTAKLKIAVRDAILANRRAFETGVMEPSFGDRLSEVFETRLAAAKDGFLFWFRNIFTLNVHDHRNWRLWASAFFRSSGSPNAWAELLLPSSCSNNLYRMYIDIMRKDDIWAMWSDVRSNLLSDWDLEMYAIHEFDDDSKNPFNWVVLTYEMNCFRKFWHELRAALTDEELVRLWSTIKNDPSLSAKSPMRALTDPRTLVSEAE